MYQTPVEDIIKKVEVTKKNDIILKNLQLRQMKCLDRVFFLKIFTPDQCAKIINTALNTWNEKKSIEMI